MGRQCLISAIMIANLLSCAVESEGGIFRRRCARTSPASCSHHETSKRRELGSGEVYARERYWTETHVVIKSGDVIVIVAGGLWTWYPDEGKVGPDGSQSTPVIPAECPLPGEHGGTLIARIGGEGHPFKVISGEKFTATENGNLYFICNDYLNSSPTTGYNDNSGSVDYVVY